MRIPGFSAESSLGSLEKLYEGSGDATRNHGGAIQPQICRRQGNTITCTDCSDGYCWTHTISIPTLY